MDIFDLATKNQAKFTENEKDTLSRMMDIMDAIPNLSINELAKQVHTSKSSILRLSQKLGFSGYSEFKYYLKTSNTEKNIESKDLLSIQTGDIEKTKSILDKLDLVRILKLFQESNRIYFYGTGYAQRNAINEFFIDILTLGKYSLFLPSKSELKLQVANMQSNDLVVIVSLSGTCNEIKDSIFQLKAKHVPFISITNFSQNFLSNQTPYNLFFYATPVYLTQTRQEFRTFLGLHIVFDTIFRLITQDHYHLKGGITNESTS